MDQRPLNLKPETLKFLEDNMGNFTRYRCGEGLHFEQDSVSQGIKANNELTHKKWALMKVKALSWKRDNQSSEEEPTGWEFLPATQMTEN